MLWYLALVPNGDAEIRIRHAYNDLEKSLCIEVGRRQAAAAGQSAINVGLHGPKYGGHGE